MPAVVVHSSQDFFFARVRIMGMYGTTGGQPNGLLDDILDQYAKGNQRQQLAARYGKAVLFLQAKKFRDAENIIQPLLQQHPDNLWFLDIMSDIDIGLKQPAAAVKLLTSVSSPLQKNPVIQLNLANARLEAGQPGEARTLLNRYTWSYPDDPNGWDLLTQANAALGDSDEVLFAQAQGLALNGQLEQAIRALTSASGQVPVGSLKQARYDARIDQLRQLQQRFRQYQKG